MNNIQMLIFDIDGVITDGKRYIGKTDEIKTVSLKDLDALNLLRESGYKIGCISGEDTTFSRNLSQMVILDSVSLGCKRKADAVIEICKNQKIALEELCYIGDGKYDIPVLEMVGLGICPADAIDEVKQVATVVLSCKGGEGCIAECYTLLERRKNLTDQPKIAQIEAARLVRERVTEHTQVLDALAADNSLIGRVDTAIQIINESYRAGGCLFLCGNGGSAADAQHLAAEMVGRFYLERPALRAEALTVNTSILTALSNDYEFNSVFSRQLEARAKKGDVLIGITTSGTSENILRVFKRAKELDVRTILMTGDIRAEVEILSFTDCLLNVPSRNTPRIQEMHILIGHIICEAVEKAAVAVIKKENK